MSGLRPATPPRTDANRVSMSFARNDIVHLLDALEAVIEAFPIKVMRERKERS